MAIHQFSVIFTFWIATLALWLARNDGHKESTLCYFAMTAHHCHFELSIESEKSINLTNLKIQKIQEFRKFKKIKNKNPRI